MKIKKLTIDIFAVFAASVLYAVSINLFLQPHGITVGGVTGIAETLNSLFGLPVGLMIFAINIPLVILSAKVLGIRFIIKSAVGLLAISAAIELLPAFPVISDDIFLCSIFGGALMGLSLGLLFFRGFSTGGSDFAVWMLKKKFPHISTGLIYLLTDTAVIVFAAAIMRTPEGLLYSVITVFASKKAIDLVLSLGENSQTLIIISEKHREIGEFITDKFARGVTVVNASGFYSNSEKKLLICAMSENQLYPILSGIKELDGGAFIICQKTNRIIGNGFKQSGEII